MPPVAAAEFAALMAPLGPFEPGVRLAVAVSGGADSLALALLAHDWAVAQGGSVVALTVDHHLRPDSTAEARQVAGWLAQAGIPHHILHWLGDKPAAHIQASARAARYALLEDWCRDHEVLHLLLAHHRDDQAETLLLRLGRGSGLDGLAAMAPVSESFHCRRLRPLLTIPKTRLESTLAARGQDWVRDPSNRNENFSRVRLRGLMPALAAEGMSPDRLAATAARLGRSRAALEFMVAEAASRWVEFSSAGFAYVDPRSLVQPPEDVALRLLSRLLTALGGAAYPPRLDRLEALHGRLVRGLDKAATLAGCRIQPLGGRLLVCREAAKVAPPVKLLAGDEIIWDGRYRLRVAEDAPPGLVLGALTVTGWRKAAALMAGRALPVIPAAVRPTLPAVYREDAICEVPHLGYNRGGEGEKALRWIVAAPANPLTVAGHRLVLGGDVIIS